MHDLVKAEYQGFSYSFNGQGWFNATEAAERFGKRVNDWLVLPGTKEYLEALARALQCNSSSLLNIKRGGNQRTNTRNSGIGGTWLHPKLAVAFARWLSTEFSIWCDFQIDELIRGKHPHFDWKRSRHQSAASYKVTCQILQMTRERMGKATAPHHYSNEARLINWALTGEFDRVDRNALSTGDLDLLAKLENLDTVLIGSSMSYEARKAELERFARNQRIKLSAIA